MESSNKSKPIVMIVEDDCDARYLLEKVLSNKSGFSVVSFNSPEVALESLRAGKHFDLIVSDYVLPVMTGVDLINCARLIHPGIPSMLVSGSDKTLASLPKDTLWIEKPIDVDLLRKMAAELPGNR